MDRLEEVSQPKGGTEIKDSTVNAVSILHEIETCTWLIHHLPFQRILVVSQETCWIINYAGFVSLSDFLWSPSLPLSLTPSRKHKQCFCPGLHQWIPDSEWAAGQRKPPLLSRILSDCQGELPNVGGVIVWRDCRRLEKRLKGCFTAGLRENFDMKVYSI